MIILDRLERNQAIGLHRQNIVADILDYIHRKKRGTSVYTIHTNYSVVRSVGSREHITWIYREGDTIVVRPKKSSPDILIYRDGKLKSAWEITNYDKTSFMKWDRLYRYIKNLSKFDCDKILVVSYPENFRKVHSGKTEAYNIENTENLLAKKGIFVVYLGWYDKLPEQNNQGCLDKQCQ